jgi:hypothetical protein
MNLDLFYSKRIIAVERGLRNAPNLITVVPDIDRDATRVTSAKCCRSSVSLLLASEYNGRERGGNECPPHALGI